MNKIGLGSDSRNDQEDLKKLSTEEGGSGNNNNQNNDYDS